jgi:hypothetical protein
MTRLSFGNHAEESDHLVLGTRIELIKNRGLEVIHERVQLRLEIAIWGFPVSSGGPA